MMSFLLGLAGIIIGVVIFLNFLSAGNDARAILQSARKKPQPGSDTPPVFDAGKVLRKSAGVARPRICPVCGTALTRSEYLIAALEPEPGDGRKRQAHIYGCPHCYSTGGVNLEQRELTKMEP